MTDTWSDIKKTEKGGKGRKKSLTKRGIFSILSKRSREPAKNWQEKDRKRKVVWSVPKKVLDKLG